jgi:DNA-binding response OmpR family regulator
MKILVVEDEKDIREVFHDFLDALEIDHDTAEDGNSALKLIENNEYSLIFTDLKLPDIEGYEIIKKVREKNKNCCIAVISGFLEGDAKEKVLKLGANYYIEKPFSFAEIKEIIENCL